MQIGLYSISFGFGWGPIGWLIPSEIHDLNTRAAGQSITVFTQLVSGATVTQSEHSCLFVIRFDFWSSVPQGSTSSGCSTLMLVCSEERKRKILRFLSFFFLHLLTFYVYVLQMLCGQVPPLTHGFRLLQLS